MFTKTKANVPVSKIAKFLGIKFIGKDFNIKGVTSLDSLKDSHLLFFTEMINLSFNVKEKKKFKFSNLKKYSNVLMITDKENASKIPCLKFLSKNPRLDFEKVLNHFFVKKIKPTIHPTAVVEKGVILGNNIGIGAHSFIEKGVKIGNNTNILHNVIITGKVTIGSDCVIKSNSTIGSEGFGFTRDGEKNFHFPHIGEILIGNRVWLGSNVSIEKGSLDVTIINDDVVVDDLVQIGHNVKIGRSSQITAGCVISGRAVIEEGCWLAPNATIDNAVNIGRNALVGMGSVVRKDVSKNMIVVGNPAKELRKKK